jgi:anti-anti-sigma factor
MADFKLETGRLEVAGMYVKGPDTEQLEDLGGDLLDQEPKELIIDLRRLDHVDSSALGVLSHLWVTSLALHKELCVLPSDSIRRVFEISGFDHVLQIKDDSDDAP